VNPRIGWGQPPTGWPQLPGWAPLVDSGPRPLRAARSLRRWWWPTVTVGGFLAVVVQVLDHDDPAPGLSGPGLVTIALAAAVVALLTIHRRYGPRLLARAVAEYTVVALLATLLVAPGVGLDQQPAHPATPQAGQAKPQAEAAAGDDQPAVIRAGAKVVQAAANVARSVIGAVRWLVDLWHQASQKTAANSEATVTPPRSPTPFAPSIWRSHT
jgi:4-amino-4-deoxy-L-arabinose transferase-like glycosyltransferase